MLFLDERSFDPQLCQLLLSLSSSLFLKEVNFDQGIKGGDGSAERRKDGSPHGDSLKSQGSEASRIPSSGDNKQPCLETQEELH